MADFQIIQANSSGDPVMVELVDPSGNVFDVTADARYGAGTPTYFIIGMDPNDVVEWTATGSDVTLIAPNTLRAVTTLPASSTKPAFTSKGVWKYQGKIVWHDGTVTPASVVRVRVEENLDD